MSYFIDRDYGSDFPDIDDHDYGQSELWDRLKKNGGNLSQIAKELIGFRLNGKKAGMMSRYKHGLNLLQLLWPKEIALWVDWTDRRTDKTHRIYNHCFLEIFKACCNGNRVGLTGAGATGKTFAVAAYAILMFMADPENITIFVSTTSSSDAERRVWGEIKSLHTAASQRFPVGTCIDYLKSITFDPGRELEGRRDVKERDLRNGIILIPIPKGEEGQAAVGKIIGTHQKKLIWIIDELPHMITQILDSEANLMKNMWYQLIGIGNANLKTDPHGKLCEPRAGWKSVSVATESWTSIDGADVVFLHGERTPNYHPAVDQAMQEASDYPFPYLSNEGMNRKVAMRYGRGDETRGRNSIEYIRFGIGFWKGDSSVNRILSPELIYENRANLKEVVWGEDGYITLCGADFGFTSGGDKNSATFAKLGRDSDGNQRLVFEEESVIITAQADDRVSFRKLIAKSFVAECKQRGVKPNQFGCDINADGGLMMQEIMREWNTTEIVGLSSLEPSTDDRYANIVTQYWMSMTDVVATGNVRGFNTESNYAADLFEREYRSMLRGLIAVETKKEMKKRIKRSPDCGDSAAYVAHMSIRHGFDISIVEVASPKPWAGSRRHPLEGFESEEDDGYASSADEGISTFDDQSGFGYVAS